MSEKNSTYDSRSVFNNLLFLIKNAWKWEKSIFYYCGFYTIFSAILPFISIIFPKLIIDELTNNRNSEKLLLILFCFFVISSTINYLVSYLNSSYYPKMTKLRFNFMYLLQKKCMTMDFKHTEDPDVLNDVNTAWRALTNNSDGIEGVFHKIFSLLSNILAFLGYVTIVITLNPLILLYLILNVLLTYCFTIKVKRYEYTKRNVISQCYRKSHYIFNTMCDFSYGKDIRIYSLNSLLSTLLNKFNSELIFVKKNIQNKYFLVLAFDTFLLLIREGIIYAYLIYKVLYCGMGIGNFTMYFATISSFTIWMTKVMDDIAYIKSQNLYINDFRNFLELDSKIKDKKEVSLPSKKPYEIEFKNVSFKYPNSDKYILKNISLKIKAGQRIAIVGVNGAGKTTLIKLLTGLYEPTEGEILINNINISKFNKEEYFKLFSVVFQNFKIFAFSIAENISLTTGNSINIDLVNKCLIQVGLNDKVNSLENGINTSILKILDPAGTELSGGENQKIAIARALYKNGDIVILDEPTASLDPIAEYNIYKNFDNIIGNKTSIYISHRLSSTRFCDAIALFENGMLQEYGTHEQLLQKNGKYYEMFHLQACYYKDETSEIEFKEEGA